MQRELSEIIKDFIETKKKATIILEEVPYNVRQGVGIAKRTAEEKLPTLQKELHDTVIPGKLVAVFATGDDVSLAKAAEIVLKGNGIVLDVNEMYKKIAAGIEPTYSRDRTFSIGQFHALLKGFRDVAESLNLPDIPSYQYFASIDTICPDTRSTMLQVRRILRKESVDEINKKYLTKTIISRVLELSGEIRQIPVLVVDNLSEEEKRLIGQLFSTTTEFEFTPNFNVSKQTISKIFKNSQNGNGAVTAE